VYKIVFVDDEPIILEGLKYIIDWDKYDVSIVGSATNTEDALVMIKEFNPEIIITDIRMQSSSGLEMIEQLKKDGYEGCIIILSGYRDFEYAQRAIENNVYRYLLKPLDVGKFEDMISGIVDSLNLKKDVNSSKNSIEEIMKYINAHFSEDISLGEIAKMHHYEVSGFSRAIKKHTGMNYTDYVAKLRVEYAKRYLTDTTRSIEDITEIVGYKSVRYFRETFEKYTGVTPSQYRKENRKK